MKKEKKVIWGRGDNFKIRGNNLIQTVMDVEVNKYYQTDFERTYVKYKGIDEKNKRIDCWVDTDQIYRVEKKSRLGSK